MEPILLKLSSDREHFVPFISDLEHRLRDKGDVYVPYKLSFTEQAPDVATILVIPGSAYVATFIYRAIKEFLRSEHNKDESIIIERGSIRHTFKARGIGFEETFLENMFPEMVTQNDLDTVIDKQQLQNELSSECQQALRKLDAEVASHMPWHWVSVGVVGYDSEPTGYRNISEYDVYRPNEYEGQSRQIIPHYSTDAKAVREVEGWIKSTALVEYIDLLASEGLNANTATPEQKCRVALHALSWRSKR